MDGLCPNIYQRVVLDGLQKKESTKYKTQELHDLHNDYPLALQKKNESNEGDVIPILRINKRKIRYQYWSST